MGWFWGASPSPSHSTTTSKQTPPDDPLRSLDPSLRTYLERESPLRKQPSSSPPPAASTAPTPLSYAGQVSPPPACPPPSATLSPPPACPPPSATHPPTLFPDGRYASLWTTYTPLSAIEASSKTDQEKLLDVLDSHAFRKAETARAALENCALEQTALSDCYTNGGWWKKMSMCRTEDAGLRRCYLMQQKFLKALGYLAHLDRPAETDERIQMHADKLFHRMLDEEKAAKEAKEKGLPPPRTAPLIPTRLPDTLGAAGGDATPAVLGHLSPAKRQIFDAHLKGLSPLEREVEEKAFAAEILLAERVGREVDERHEERMAGRRRRREEGKAGVGDRVGGWFGW